MFGIRRQNEGNGIFGEDHLERARHAMVEAFEVDLRPREAPPCP
jgi:hypothetical protein